MTAPIPPSFVEANGYSSQDIPGPGFIFVHPESRLFFLIWEELVVLVNWEGFPLLWIAFLILAQTAGMFVQSNTIDGQAAGQLISSSRMVTNRINAWKIYLL